MLHVDLTRLGREGRARVDADVHPGDPFWAHTELSPHSPLFVRLEAQQAGADVVVRGRLSGEFDLECRRCLAPVVGSLDEELGLLYREAESLAADEPAEVLPLPERGDLDLSGAVREQVLLAVPRYVACADDCRGLCPRCGINRNESTCECAPDEVDERWSPLRRLKLDE